VEFKNRHFNFVEFRSYLPEEKSSTGDLIAQIGRLFLGAPYAAQTLDRAGRERLIVNFHQFDCTTFVETVLALARCASRAMTSCAGFRRELQFIRYRGGVLDGYSSRLHYFTDWLRDNQKKKILSDLTRHPAGVPLSKKINYMTTHRESYPAFGKENEFQKMLQVEKNLFRKVFYVIGKDKTGAQKAKIGNGDIIAFSSSEKGLDVAHVGFALRQGRNLHLLHASSVDGGVVISKKTLAACLKQNKNFTGIIIARPS
jgi:hypothetical protein